MLTKVLLWSPGPSVEHLTCLPPDTKLCPHLLLRQAHIWSHLGYCRVAAHCCPAPSQRVPLRLTMLTWLHLPPWEAQAWSHPRPHLSTVQIATWVVSPEPSGLRTRTMAPSTASSMMKAAQLHITIRAISQAGRPPPPPPPCTQAHVTISPLNLRTPNNEGSWRRSVGPD